MPSHWMSQHLMIASQHADIWAIRATWELVRVLRECLHELELDLERSDSDVNKVSYQKYIVDDSLMASFSINMSVPNR